MELAFLQCIRELVKRDEQPRAAHAHGPGRGTIHPGTTMGPVSLTVADLATRRRLLPARARPARRSRAPATASRWARRPGRALVELRGRPRRAGAPAPQHRPLPPGDPRARPRAGARCGGAPRRRAPAGVHGRLGPPGERGPLPRRPRGQRHRDLPRPPARGVAPARAASSRWPPCRSTSRACSAPCPRERRTRACRRARGWATSTSRCATSPRPRRFYAAALGFEPTVRGYPGALFVSAGGYHHHLGLNTWGTAGAPPPPPGARGLRAYRVVVPGRRRGVARRRPPGGARDRDERLGRGAARHGSRGQPA